MQTSQIKYCHQAVGVFYLAIPVSSPLVSCPRKFVQDVVDASPESRCLLGRLLGVVLVLDGQRFEEKTVHSVWYESCATAPETVASTSSS
jgi:hypothetical protein